MFCPLLWRETESSRLAVNETEQQMLFFADLSV